MKQRRWLSPILCAAMLAASCADAENWPGWRGPRQNGSSIEEKVPTQWEPSQATWFTKLPGIGHASPIVWGDRVLTATALPETQERILLCLDRATGDIVWQETVVQGALEKIHPENSYASGTPATDGERVYAMFRVDDDLVAAAHDLATGKQLWRVQPGTHVGEWGFSSSPVLYKNMVILDGDNKGDSFLLALNGRTGETVWRQDRENKGISYSAPLLIEVDGHTQLIQCGDRRVTALDPDTGTEIWTVDGPSQEFVATPSYSPQHNLVYVSSSWPETMLLAIRPDGRGNVTDSHVVWSSKRGAPYTPSMLVVGDFLLTLTRSGHAFCFDAASGEILWQERLERHHASPVLIAGLVYLVNDDGQVHVIHPDRDFKLEARYALGENCYASPAISGGQVFIRGFDHLYCFGTKTAG